MEPSDPIEEKRLPDESNGNYIWKEIDSSHNTECFDGENRECGSIRITPYILDVIETPIPRKYLGRSLSDMALDPFLGFADFGLVFAIDSDRDLFSSQIWSRNPISEFLPPDQAEKIEDDLIGLCLVNPSLDKCIFKRDSSDTNIYVYDLEEENLIDVVHSEDIKFLDVPDDTIIEYIPDEYLSELISQEI